MRIPGLASEYIRTCADCGYTWRVPRGFTRGRFQSLSAAILENNLRTRPAPGADPRFLPPARRAADGQRQAFRRCPECGSGAYAQRPARD
jgi:hypothetical protein